MTFLLPPAALHVPPQRPTINCAINLWIRCGSLLREILTSRGVAAPDTHIFMSASRSKVPAVSNEKRVTERHGMLRNSFFDPVSPCTSTRSEEHTSELQSLMRISYAVFCLK